MTVLTTETSENVVEPPTACYGARHTQAIMLFLLITIGYAMRVNLSVGIVAMTDPDANPSNPDIPTYDWSDTKIVLSSFFWGYVVTQVGAGQLAKKFGAKWFIAGAMCICSLFSILIPVMAPLGSWGVMICRVMQGLTQGFFFPCCHTILAKWVPPTERSRIGTFVYAGGPFGTVISLPTTGWIATSSIGWPYAFYIFGIIGLLWAVGWAFLGRNSPAEHPFIDPQEKAYIETSLGKQERKLPPTPWKALATSLPLWAILVAHSGQNWGFSTLLTNIPTYMNDVLNYDLANNSLLSAGPYFLFWILSFAFSSASDYIISHNICSVGVARKIANSIGLYVPAAALLTLGLISSIEDIANPTLALLFIAVGINSCCFCGYNVNHIDLSPNHAGTLMGITNGFSNIFSIIAPLIIQFIVTEQGNAEQWAIIFYIAAGAYTIGNTFFIIFGSGDIQWWDGYEPKKSDSESVSSRTNKSVPVV